MKIKSKLLTGLSVILFTFWGIHHESQAQAGYMTGSDLGMGSAGMAMPGGVSMQYKNPAMASVNLDQRRIGVSIGGFGLSSGGGLLNIDAYNRHFTKGAFLGNEEKEQALTDFFGADDYSIQSGAVSLQVVPLGFSLRIGDTYYTLSSRLSNHSKAGINRGMMDLLLNGFDSEQFSDGKPINLTTRSLSYSDVTFGSSRKWFTLSGSGRVRSHSFYSGVASGYVIGHQYGGLDLDSEMTVQEDRIVHDFTYTIHTTGPGSTAADIIADSISSGQSADFGDAYTNPVEDGFIRGVGWNLNIGAAWVMEIEPLSRGVFFGSEPHFLNISLAVTDIGQITFSENPAIYQNSDTVVWEGLKGDPEYIEENYDDFEHYFESTLKDSILTGKYLDFEKQQTDAHEVKLPALATFGTYLKMGRLGIAADMGFGLVEEGMNTRSVHYALGVHYDLFGFIPLRTGARFGGMTSTSYSAGIGINTSFFDFELSAMTVSNSGSNGTHLAAAFGGLNFRF